GWKGLINDPNMDGTFDIASGLRKARKLILQLGEMGLPAGTEMLDPISPPYFSDLVTWASIGARTTESQTHRQMASGLSMPIGYKNSTDGDIQTAIDAVEASRHSHSFLGIDMDGQTCIVNTKGNPLGHLILRGGRSGPNYDSASIAAAAEQFRKRGITHRVMVDCSHANSNKQYWRQEEVWRSVVDQIVSGGENLLGMMLESNLSEGSQKIPADKSKLQYGVSITDGCIGWEKTVELIHLAADSLRSLPVTSGA
ncbi:MAG: 3-deoxy-7-phosphoheptulonate synthase, partial [Armatimonadetes bacterium]|nr:3-deoxy-7-phosphoheptulonate synthase [Armatimonadota bacterium]